MHTVWHSIIPLQSIIFQSPHIKHITKGFTLITDGSTGEGWSRWPSFQNSEALPCSHKHVRSLHAGFSCRLFLLAVVITNSVTFFTVNANGALTLREKKANSHHSCKLRSRARAGHGVKGHLWRDLLPHNQWTQGQAFGKQALNGSTGQRVKRRNGR